MNVWDKALYYEYRQGVINCVLSVCEDSHLLTVRLDHTADACPYVMGWIVGHDWDPNSIAATNKIKREDATFRKYIHKVRTIFQI